MIVVRLSGGLGNQMFQYAAGRSLSLFHKTNVVFDTVEFEYAWLKPWIAQRKYELNCFSLPARMASDRDINSFIGSKFRNLTPLRRRAKFYYHEAGFCFDPNVFDRGKNLYMDGYWQSPRYFEQYSSVILQDFAWKYPVSSYNNEVASQICASESIGVHVRRGDYVNNPKVQAHHGVCSKDYYYAAVSYLKEQVQSPRLFVFSDDPDWVKSHMQFDLPTVVVWNNQQQAPPAEDMRLMSLCKHNVIANSSFSWWAAWLNENPAKLVVAPQSWFVDSTINTVDLIPEKWIRI